jgi:hypothetical protein
MSWLDTWFVPVAVRYNPMGVSASQKVSELCHQAGQGPAWAQGFIPGLGVGHLGIFGSVFLVGEVNGDSVCLLELFDR